MEVSVIVGYESLTFHNVTMINYNYQPLHMRVEWIILILIIVGMNAAVIRFNNFNVKKYHMSILIA